MSGQILRKQIFRKLQKNHKQETAWSATEEVTASSQMTLVSQCLFSSGACASLQQTPVIKVLGVVSHFSQPMELSWKLAASSEASVTTQTFRKCVRLTSLTWLIFCLHQ